MGLHMCPSMVQVYSSQIQRIIVAKLEPGEDILKMIETVAKEHDIRMGQLNLIGAVERAVLGYFDRESGEYRSRTIERDLEVVSCMGNIGRLEDGTVAIHAHMIVADDGAVCYGGHVLPGCRISVTGELVIVEGRGILTRARDERTGLNLLKLM